MAWAPRISAAAATTAANAVGAMVNSGVIKIYGGTQPAGPGTATTEVPLAGLAFGVTAFAASSSGIMAANAITSTTAAVGTGTATWYRAFGGATTTNAAVFDGSVGVTTADNMVLNSVAISSGASVSISAFTFTFPMTS